MNTRGKDAPASNRFRVVLRWLLRNVVPGFAISILVLTVGLLADEFYLRSTRPFFIQTWPTKFVDQVGFIYNPGSTMRATNHRNFWTENKINVLGFPDREPPEAGPPEPGVCRVAIFGDSFIEARQVPIEEKVQVQFERLANARIKDRQFQTLAFSHSGTGQSNQLPIYDVFARQFHPHVVVLAMVFNDFANNSPFLESIRHGWGPSNAPRLFFAPDEKTGRFEPIPVDPDWYNHVLQVPQLGSSGRMAVHQWLEQRSHLYVWFHSRLSASYPEVARWLAGTALASEHYAARAAALKASWPGRVDLGNWPLFDDWSLDVLFAAKTLPPAATEALALTGHALDEFADRARRDNFKLLILATGSMNLAASVGPDYLRFLATSYNDPLTDGEMMRRLNALARPRGIPVVDQAEYIQSLGRDLREFTIEYDGHWNAQGHRGAAEALLRYFREHPDLCDRVLPN